VFGGGQSINFDIFLPLRFVTLTVNFSMMGAAKPHGKLIPATCRLTIKLNVSKNWRFSTNTTTN
jgi:hypothetical protein